MLGATLVEMLPVAHQDALFWCCINVFCILICVTAAIFPFKFQMFVFLGRQLPNTAHYMKKARR